MTKYSFILGVPVYEGGNMAIIRRDRPASSEEEISDETNELVKEVPQEIVEPLPADYSHGLPDPDEEVTQNNEDENPEQHIGQPVDYDLGEEEAKSQNRTSDGRFASIDEEEELPFPSAGSST